MNDRKTKIVVQLGKQYRRIRMSNTRVYRSGELGGLPVGLATLALLLTVGCQSAAPAKPAATAAATTAPAATTAATRPATTPAATTAPPQRHHPPARRPRHHPPRPPPLRLPEAQATLPGAGRRTRLVARAAIPP